VENLQFKPQRNLLSKEVLLSASSSTTPTFTPTTPERLPTARLIAKGLSDMLLDGLLGVEAATARSSPSESPSVFDVAVEGSAAVEKPAAVEGPAAV
jgi:hypothetical protein